MDEQTDNAGSLNLALSLKTEWGENFEKPIDARILVHYPKLTTDEIAGLTKLAREAEYFVYDLAEQELAGKITEPDIIPTAKKHFPWLDDTNSQRLRSIGMFYAKK